MSSRMNKYYNEDELISTRYSRNEDLYKEISKSELNNFEVKSNTTILGENEKEIDVEKIKKILDTKYNSLPKRKSIRIEDVEEEKVEQEDTKEYDINVILEKAREKKSDNYEEERFKKLRDTQYDILNNLNLNKNNLDDDECDAEENLKTLINTIALNEKNSQNDSLDILSELKGSDNTEVLEGLKEETEDVNKIEEEKEDLTSTKMINSFYTSSNALNEDDFEDIEDFSKSIETNNVFIKVIIGIVILIFVIGIILLIKTFILS